MSWNHWRSWWKSSALKKGSAFGPKPVKVSAMAAAVTVIDGFPAQAARLHRGRRTAGTARCDTAPRPSRIRLPSAAAGARARAASACPSAATTGPLNAITDVAGVSVGYGTADSRAMRSAPASPRCCRGRRRELLEPVLAGFFALNGNGEMTGTHWIEEAGLLPGPADDHQHALGRHRPPRDRALAGPALSRGSSPARSGRCRWWPRPMTAGSTMSPGCM